MANTDKDTVLVARVIVQNEGDVLIVRRSETDERAGIWEIPGGLVETGESIEDGAKREVKEETGIDVAELKFQYSNAYKYKDQQRVGSVFTANTDSDIVVLSEEHDEFAWVNISNYDNNNLDKHYYAVLKKFFKTEENTTKLKSKNVQNTTKDVDKLKIFTDGGSRGNPGPSASGYVILTMNDEVLEEGGEYLGLTTNNQAEYQAVKLALQVAERYSPKEIDFYIDSLLVVNQMTGKFKIKNRDLWPINQDIKALSEKYKKVTYTHVRREYNTLADAKVNEVLDSYEHRN